MNEPLFLIECTDNRGYYIHRESDILNILGRIKFVIKHGKDNAAAFTYLNAREFIRRIEEQEQKKADNLEIVPAE